MALDRIKKLLEPDVSLNAKLIGVSLFFGRLFETTDKRLVDLEARQLQKGDKGDKGERGEKGERGDQGVQGVPGAVGPQGKAGPAGKDGKKGKDGISVVDSEVAADGHLVLKLSNGEIIDAGPLPEGDGRYQINTQLANNQITVSPTPPTNPVFGQLWFDIS